MSHFKTLKQLLFVFQRLDDYKLLSAKLDFITSWLEKVPGVIRAMVLDFSIQGKLSRIFRKRRQNVERELVSLIEEDFKSFLPHEPRIINLQDHRFIALLPDARWGGELICYPIQSCKQELLSVLMIKSENCQEFQAENHLELGFLALKLKDLFELDLMENNFQKEQELLTIFFNQKNGPALLSEKGKNSLIDWLNLPLYVSDLEGNFVFANQGLYKRFNIHDVDELNHLRNIIFPEKEWQKEMQIILQKGWREEHLLSFTLPDGKSLSVKNSAVRIGDYIFGFFLKVTENAQLNKDLREALEMQELLNDKLLSSSLLLQKTQSTTIRSLARLAEYRDGETGEHLSRISEYSSLLANEVYKRQPYNFNITKQYVADFSISSMLHDIGKVGIPDRILLKNGSLNRNEYELMQNHTIWGWAILNQADMELGEQSYLTIATAIALHHHEKYNGRGYPHNLKGEKIPLSARIEALADVYDALTSKRPYKEAWPHEKAMAEIISQRGEHFDPLLVDIFVDIQESIELAKNRFTRSII
ncbi:MAG: HD domain-containing protein [Spirochaetales bacterium]|nr:HD domain-containing protein [Spirochaetales bacterium]